MYCPGTVNKLFLQSKGWVAIFSSHLKSLSERKRIGEIFEALFQPYNHMSHTFNVDECRNCLWQWLIIFPLRDVQDRKYRTFFGTLCVSANLQKFFLWFVKQQQQNKTYPPPNSLSLSSSQFYFLYWTVVTTYFMLLSFLKSFIYLNQLLLLFSRLLLG